MCNRLPVHIPGQCPVATEFPIDLPLKIKDPDDLIWVYGSLPDPFTVSENFRAIVFMGRANERWATMVREVAVLPTDSGELKWHTLPLSFFESASLLIENHFNIKFWAQIQ